MGSETNMQRNSAHVAIVCECAAIVFGLLLVWSVGESCAERVRGLSLSAAHAIAPEGYRLAKHIPWQTSSGDQFYRIGVFTDSDEAEPKKPVALLLLGWKGKWVVHDTVLPHHKPGVATPDYDAPNYFEDINRVQVDSRFLVLLRTTVFWGGSGSLQYFDFYDVMNHRLTLVKSFQHGRMERYYFALYKGVIYDADLVCRRGERRRRSYVHTCYLDVKKYHFDGQDITAVASERLREKQGPWFLCDSYRFMNIGQALKNDEVFGDAQ